MVKKQLIMEKALELFANQGFEATSVQQITDQCGISKGAFYLSFKSKDELILTLIESFMEQITADIDHIVKNTDKDQLLYAFYYQSYQFLYQHVDFAKILMKEQPPSFSQELIHKLRSYDQLNEKIILTMIERIYGDSVNDTKYDLIFCIKSFLKTYAEMFFLQQEAIDFHGMAESLVEKTNILAAHMTLPFITQEHNELVNNDLTDDISSDDLIHMIEQKAAELEDSLEKESLLLLKQELLQPSLNPVLIHGLIVNIRNHPHCKWIAYLLDHYYQREK